MSSSNINDPFVLASYTSSFRGKAHQKYTPGVYASSYKRPNKANEFVTVAVQADGVHILDVSTLHPSTSRTLGPSTSFSCPPLTVPSASSSTTCAIISSSPELSSLEDSGRTLWVWEDDVTSAKQKEKRNKTLFAKGKIVQNLYACEDIPGRITALSTSGDVEVIDIESLETKSSLPSSDSSNTTHAWLFSANTTPLSRANNGATLVTLSSGTSKTIHLRIFAIDEADSISQEHEWEISIDAEKLASVSCSSSGVLSALTIDGVWNSYRLSSESPTHLASPIYLSALSFISASSKYPVSLLALTSSHVLLAAVASQEINLLLWDLQFSVLLSSHTLSIPSALSSSQLHIRLLPGSQTPTKDQSYVAGQAILILSSIPQDSSTKSTSVLLVVPYSVPTTSTIAAAMGRGGVGKKWLRNSEEQTSSESVKPSAEETVRINLLATMRTAMQGGRPQAAVAAFMRWAPQSDETTPATLDYNFVKDILNIVLSSDSKMNGAAAYSPDIIQYLLKRRTVCSAMVQIPGGLLGALRTKNDWKSIELAFSTVLDLSESELMETLQTVVSRHRQTFAAAGDAMNVDSPPSSGDAVPTLPVFLEQVANYPTSRGPLVVAFRTYMKEAEDLMALLQILNTWLVRRSKMDERLLPSKKDLRKTEQGVWVVVGRKGDKDKKEDIPSLEKIIEILQIILDASFLTLLQHQPSHKILRSLSAQLRPEIAFANTIEGLRGFLEPFALAQEKAVKESLVTPQEKEREKQKGDWRQRRKGVGAAPGVGADIGLYKLEELVL